MLFCACDFCLTMNLANVVCENCMIFPTKFAQQINANGNILSVDVSFKLRYSQCFLLFPQLFIQAKRRATILRSKLYEIITSSRSTSGENRAFSVVTWDQFNSNEKCQSDFLFEMQYFQAKWSSTDYILLKQSWFSSPQYTPLHSMHIFVCPFLTAFYSLSMNIYYACKVFLSAGLTIHLTQTWSTWPRTTMI